MNPKKRLSKGKQIKSRRKSRDGEWHHRVPDFKLVYCGKQDFSEKESEKLSNN